MRGVYTADFETTTDPKDCRVWLWCVCNVDTKQTNWGKDIKSFFNWISNNPVQKLWFHNLNFDGSFIIDYLLKHGYTHTTEFNPLKGQISTLVSGDGKFYQFKIKFVNGHTVTINDSAKVFPMSVADIAKIYKMETTKGEIDYKKTRPVGYDPTPEEIDYIERDVIIPATALEFNYQTEMKKITAGSNAFTDFVSMFGGMKSFRRVFPLIPQEIDTELRKAYRGGYVQVSQNWEGKETPEGISVDYNSMYPSQLLLKPFPYGEPMLFEGEYELDPLHPLYVQQLTCTFDLKPGGLPTIQLNHAMYGKSVYVKHSSEVVTLWLSNVDLELFFDNYNVDIIKWQGGYKFKAATGFFEKFIRKWAKVKKENEGGLRNLAKLNLNSLYGKFGTNPVVNSKNPEIEDDKIKWVIGDSNTRDSIYVPVAIYATAYARKDLMDAIKLNKERFIYCDTDSMHLVGYDDPKGITLHDSNFGAWKVEGTFSRSKHLRAKTYILDCSNTPNPLKAATFDGYAIGCAGMPANVKNLVTWENFEVGFNNLDEHGEPLKGYGKLIPKAVPGGVVLVDMPFEIKA